jgi:hypothetical protein
MNTHVWTKQCMIRLQNEQSQTKNIEIIKLCRTQQIGNINIHIVATRRQISRKVPELTENSYSYVHVQHWITTNANIYELLSYQWQKCNGLWNSLSNCAADADDLDLGRTTNRFQIGWIGSFLQKTWSCDRWQKILKLIVLLLYKANNKQIWPLHEISNKHCLCELCRLNCINCIMYFFYNNCNIIIVVHPSIP